MNKIECMNTIANYMKINGYRHFENFDQGIYSLNIVYDRNCENCPNEALESNICFNNDAIEMKLFYTELASSWCKRSKYKEELSELVTYINEQLLEMNSTNNSNYNTKLYITEDFDIAIIIDITYEYFTSNALQTNHYITNDCVALLNNISIPLFFVMFGKIPVEEAKGYIKNTNIIKKEKMCINDLFYS